MTVGFGPLEPAPGETSILVVDDLAEKLLVFETLLEDLNQNLVFARSGNEALREVLKREFAVILLDVNMPDIDGLETARLIRRYRRSAHTPIIFVTAYADEMQSARGYALGAVDYIMTPIVPEVLRSKVRVFVELHIMQCRLRQQADERVALAAAEAARHAAEENTRRADFLAHAGAHLVSSLDADVAMGRLLELVVPQLASRALLLLGDGGPDGLRARSAVALVPGGRHVATHALEHFDPALQHALRGLLEDGERRAVAAGVLDLPPNEVALGLPLRVGARTIGALVLAPSDQVDWSLLAALTDRAAHGFENVRLFRGLQAEIAERRQAEAQLRELHLRKDEFLAMLSHELRNPLAPIRNAIELIRRLAPPDPKLGWALDVSDRQVTQLTRLVEDLLDVARISQGKIALQLERVDLLEAVAHAIESVRPLIESRDHTLTQRLPTAPVWLRGDLTRLSQAIGNLLGNAAKYTPDGGHIELSLTVDEGAAVLSIRDDGIGMDAQLLPTVFELFRQGKQSLDRSHGGLGIGLTLVQRLVELHHGSVEAFSAGADCGSEFRIRLPCLHEVAAIAPHGGGHGTPGLDGGAARACRILVVDDNVDAAHTVGFFFELAGHEVKTVADGMEAIACAAVYAPQVVVLDIGLPGLDGYAVARRLREIPATRGALLIALTGYGQPNDRLRAEHAGFDAHYVKPADLDALARHIEHWLESGTNPVDLPNALYAGRRP